MEESQFFLGGMKDFRGTGFGLQVRKTCRSKGGIFIRNIPDVLRPKRNLEGRVRRIDDGIGENRFCVSLTCI